jgi:hypothetical protein
MFVGGEYPNIMWGQCSFRYANGDDYQTFGNSYPARTDRQWKLMKTLLSTPECGANVRLVKATVTGTVVMVPSSGKIAPNEMPLELVIQSVSDVSHVRIKCIIKSQ